MVINGLASDDSWWKKIGKEEKEMTRYVGPEFMKEYQEALEKAMKKESTNLTGNIYNTYCGSSDYGVWIANWGWGSHTNEDGSVISWCSPKLITEKDFIPTEIIFNPPATICTFPDGSKVVVKCASDEEFVEEEGVMACIVKKLFSSRNAFKKLVASAYRQPKPEPKSKAKPKIKRKAKPKALKIEPNSVTQDNSTEKIG